MRVRVRIPPRLLTYKGPKTMNKPTSKSVPPVIPTPTPQKNQVNFKPINPDLDVPAPASEPILTGCEEISWGFVIFGLGIFGIATIILILNLG